MNRKYRTAQRRGEGLSLARLSLILEDDSSVPAGVCAGGHREAVGPQGTAPAGEAAILAQAVGYNEAWEVPVHAMEPEQIAWLSCSDLKLMLQNVSFGCDDIHEFLEERLNCGRSFDESVLREFFLRDYLKCLSLISELEYRINKL